MSLTILKYNFRIEYSTSDNEIYIDYIDKEFGDGYAEICRITNKYDGVTAITRNISSRYITPVVEGVDIV